MFTPQDDNGAVVGANAYIDVAFFRAYWLDRGTDTTATADELVQAAIIRATDYLDYRFAFVGRKCSVQQTTKWPRVGAYDSDRYVVFGIPQAVKEACAEYTSRAILAALAPDPDYDSSGAAVQSKTEKVDVIETAIAYVSGAAFVMPKYPSADMRLKKTGLTRSGNDALRA